MVLISHGHVLITPGHKHVMINLKVINLVINVMMILFNLDNIVSGHENVTLKAVDTNIPLLVVFTAFCTALIVIHAWIIIPFPGG